jgi:hypothetical protein
MKEDRAHAKDYFAGLRAEGTVDKLGVGIWRDALLDVFPAVNTMVDREGRLDRESFIASCQNSKH